MGTMPLAADDGGFRRAAVEPAFCLGERLEALADLGRDGPRVGAAHIARADADVAPAAGVAPFVPGGARASRSAAPEPGAGAAQALKRRLGVTTVRAYLVSTSTIASQGMDTVEAGLTRRTPPSPTVTDGNRTHQARYARSSRGTVAGQPPGPAPRATVTAPARAPPPSTTARTGAVPGDGKRSLRCCCSALA